MTARASGERVPVSVIVPCYQAEATLSRALGSIRRQTCPPREVLLVDDASTDGTGDLIARVAREDGPLPIRAIRLPRNSGAATARNAAWDVATQPYVAFLDADDSWHPRKLELQYGCMAPNPGLALTGHGFLVARDGLPPEHLEPHPWRVVRPRRLLVSNCFPTPTVMLRRTIEQRFHPGRRYSEDYLLWLEIALAGGACARSEMPLAYMHKAPHGESGLSARRWEMEKGELANYASLASSGLITRSERYLFSALSLAKALRRAVL